MAFTGFYLVSLELLSGWQPSCDVPLVLVADLIEVSSEKRKKDAAGWISLAMVLAVEFFFIFFSSKIFSHRRINQKPSAGGWWTFLKERKKGRKKKEDEQRLFFSRIFKVRAKPTEVTGAAAAVHLPCAAVDGRKRKKKPVVDVPLTVGFPYSRVTGEKPKKMFKKKKWKETNGRLLFFFLGESDGLV